MTEILTESFCERCGTRYTFESVRPRARLKGVKVLSRGLKNFVLSDDASMDEAMATARNENDRDATSQQLDAFHKTFNFCMSCRQYTCPNCWNEAEARCLTCAPNLGREVMPAPFPDLPTTGYSMTGANGANGSNGTAHDPWRIEAEAAIAGPSGSAEDEFDAAARLDALVAPEPSTVEPVEVEPIEPVEAIEAIAAVEAPTVAEVEAMAEVQATADGPEVEAPPVAEVTAEAERAAEILAPEEPTIEAEAAAQPQAEPEPTAPASSLPEAWIVKDVKAETAAPSTPAATTEPEPSPEPAATDAETAATDDDSDPAVAARLAAMAAATIVIDDAGAERPRPKGQKAAETGGLLRRFRAGQSLDAELDAYERQETAAIAAASTPEIAEPEVAAATTEALTDPVLAAPVFGTAEAPADEAEISIAAEPATAVDFLLESASAAEDEAEPEIAVAAESIGTEPPVAAESPVVVEPDPVVAAETPVAVEPVVGDVVAQPTWRMVAPDPTAESVDDTPSIPAAATSIPGAEPQWPTRPDWTPSTGLAFLNRPAAAQGGLEALWAESNREVVTTPGAPGKAASGGVQPCVSCGLSLSGTARFCRRCGKPQAS